MVCLSLALGTAAPLAAQSTASFQGTVLDPQGAPVADAKIVVVNAGTGIETTASTDVNGGFLFASLAAVRYKVTIEKAGFKTLSIASYTLDVDTRASQIYTLSVGGVSEIIEITEAAPTIDSSTMTVRLSIRRLCRKSH
jgi:hypothetical protein